MPLAQGGGIPALPDFGGSLFMHTPFHTVESPCSPYPASDDIEAEVRVDKVRDRGIYIDSKLTFVEHIHMMVAKAHRRANQILEKKEGNNKA